MEPMSLALAVAPTVVARAFELLERLGDRADSERQLLRMLYLEARLNRELLEAVRLGAEREVQTTHASFKTIPPLLEVDAHVAALLSFPELDPRPRPRRTRQGEAEAGLLAMLRKPYPVAVRRKLDEWEEDDAARGGRKKRAPKQTTPLKSIAFVCVKVPALQKLASLPRNAQKAVRQHRYGYRLEHILLHEQELLRQIAQYDAIDALG
jgi:hypothetical protein